MKIETYKDLIQEAHRLLVTGLSESEVYHHLEDTSEWAPDSITYAIDEALKKLGQIKCILKHHCSKGKTCNTPCPAHVQLHGVKGDGGKSGESLIPSEYRFITLENSRAKATQALIYGQLKNYIKTFNKAFNENVMTSEERFKDLYLWSLEPGTGKTETSAAILNEFLNYSFLRSVMKDEQEAFRNPVFFLDVNELQKLYNGFTRDGISKERKERNSEEYYRRLSLAKKSRLVVFDDLGLRSVTEGLRGDLHDVINHRTVENLTSIYTSNKPMEELEELFSRQIYDRVRRYCIPFEFEGTSMRGDM
ncbi:DNA replication protein [Bacillus pseudomycoides]|uniref:ATP-binding protein n=1 Tax=Bacillus pseudomycoides TaxID=64104 RepID=UPI000BFBA85A|nr:ATP-binding protein [Bacillus pseudomycoides]PHB23084.1 DNA replication protein [Bacillus pseudomycoides]PHE37613.1 DNA replication protein [Bacillus pseudomycoides]